MLKHTRRLLTAGSVIAAAAALTVAGTAASMASSQGSSPAASTTLRLRVHGGSLTLVNVRHAKALGIGDELILSQPVYAAAHPRQVIGHGYIIITFATRTVSHDQVTLTLKQGDIELAGVSQGNPFQLAVIGGTGRYRNARGQATVKTAPGKSNPASLTVSLLP